MVLLLLFGIITFMFSFPTLTNQVTNLVCNATIFIGGCVISIGCIVEGVKLRKVLRGIAMRQATMEAVTKLNNLIVFSSCATLITLIILV